MRTIQTMIDQEVLVCVSALVSELAGTLASPLGEQAVELTSTVLDYEEAAREAGWKHMPSVSKNAWYRHNNFRGQPASNTDYADTAFDACEQDYIDPHEREVFEHWAVTGWFAEKLEAAGEKVDTDFAGMCVWARTTTGQAIDMDAVIERIYAETHRAEG